MLKTIYFYELKHRHNVKVSFVLLYSFSGNGNELVLIYACKVNDMFMLSIPATIFQLKPKYSNQ